MKCSLRAVYRSWLGCLAVSPGIAFVCLQTATAQQEDARWVDITGCLAVSVAEERFACYEALGGSAETAQLRDIRPCQAVSVPEERFSCYERLGPNADSNAVQAGESPAAPSAPGANQPSATASTLPGGTSSTPQAELVVEEFGRAAQVTANEEGQPELVDEVTALRELRPQQWVITLGSGQVWRQMVDKRYPLRVGQQVRIYPTRWGSSHRLAANGVGGFIQVERVDNIAP